MKRFIVASIASLLVAGAASATTFQIGALGHNAGSGFRYSLLHKGTGAGAMSGDLLAWLELDPTWNGSSLVTSNPTTTGRAFYREADGTFELQAFIYAAGLATPFEERIGIIQLRGAGFTPDRLDNVGATNTVMGTIRLDWAFDNPGTAQEWMGEISDARVLSFVDRDYGAHTTEGVHPNRKDAQQIALWGARGIIPHVNANGGNHKPQSVWTTDHPGSGNQIGMDLAIDLGGEVTNCVTRDCLPTPEPSTYVLLSTGLVGMIALRRRLR